MKLLAWITLICSIASILASKNYQVKNSSYNVAVVEYQPTRNTTLKPVEKLEENTREYLRLLDEISVQLDIIVFPESVLTFGSGSATVDISTEVPNDNVDVICNSTNPKYAHFIKNLACASIQYNTFIVINLIEKIKCEIEKCPSSGYYFYNTDVVFNRNGQVVAKYQKYNLFGESDLTKPAVPVPVTFKTELAEFGVFTCFDILFQTPTLNLTRDLRVKNIIFPTMWFSELPFLTALQTQQMWSVENDVTFISSGASNPNLGSGGTGIFLGKQGALNYTFLAHGGSSVLIHNVPITNSEKIPVIREDVDQIAKDMDNVMLLKDQVEAYTSKALDVNQSQIEEALCHGTFCCDFRLKLSLKDSNSKSQQYTYKLVAFSGVRSFSGVYNGGIELCGVIACLTESQASCGTRFPDYSDVAWPVTFESISIEANFSNSDSKIQFPNSLLSSIRPISPQYTTWTKKVLKEGEIVRRTLVLNEPQNRLMTFAIYGRDFARDANVVKQIASK